MTPLFSKGDPESMHTLALQLARMQLNPVDAAADDPMLAVRLRGWDREFSNPFGLAAGFDKNGEIIAEMLHTGLGFVEIGSVTPEPQPGNPKPRLFRLVEDEGVINRMGFNGKGMLYAQRQLKGFRYWPFPRFYENTISRGIVGVNFGKNKTQTDPVADYVALVETLSDEADYIVINVSSPNTPGLRLLQEKDSLMAIIKAVKTKLDEKFPDTNDRQDNDMGAAGADAEGKLICEERKARRPKLLVKIAPDLAHADLVDVASVAVNTMVDGLIVSNTTISRPSTLKSKHREEGGGLSGKPLKKLANETIATVYRITEGKIPLVGVGGISSAEDAYERIRNGASLVQMYSAMVYRSPTCTRKMKAELKALLLKDGFQNINEAVGANVSL